MQLPAWFPLFYCKIVFVIIVDLDLVSRLMFHVYSYSVCNTSWFMCGSGVIVLMNKVILFM